MKTDRQVAEMVIDELNLELWRVNAEIYAHLPVLKDAASEYKKWLDREKEGNADIGRQEGARHNYERVKKESDALFAKARPLKDKIYELKKNLPEVELDTPTQPAPTIMDECDNVLICQKCVEGRHVRKQPAPTVPDEFDTKEYVSDKDAIRRLEDTVLSLIRWAKALPISPDNG